MVIKLSPQLEAALSERAQQRGVALETLVLEALREKYLRDAAPVEPRDDWERRLFGAALNCGISVPDAALSSDSLHE